MLWVWADSGPTAFIDSAVRGPRIPSFLEEHTDEYVPLFPVMARDLMYGHNLLVENVMDPSHVPFAHHGVQGSRDAARPLRITRLNTEDGQDPSLLKFDIQTLGVPAGSGKRKGPPRKRNLEFIFPSAVDYHSMPPGEAGGLPTFLSTFYCTPTSVGKCRILSQFMIRRDTKPGGNMLRRLAKLLNKVKPPKWLLHMGSNKVLDGDMILLHNQGHTMERLRNVRGKLKHQDMFYLAAGADGAVVDLLEWYHDPARGGGGPRGPGGELLSDGPEETREEVILDRYEQHTKHCHACSGALRVVESLKPVAQWATVTLAATFLSLALRAESGVAVLSKGWPLVLCTVICVVAIKLLTEIQRRLRFVPYEHHSS
ncbi:unnamed protein product [Ostreobium quekettii]|uniref:Pheophorbide a oxygenase domain-containing protein n=1 Tax=Ostreobium quekettii TaxID=121088 RepID=A0A8S1J4M3_9CHLO|nr:unnamed protein product [Ostreobium quekettii]